MLRASAFALRLALGEVADELLLSSLRVVPQKLLAVGFSLAGAQIGAALRGLLAD